MPTAVDVRPAEVIDPTPVAPARRWGRCSTCDQNTGQTCMAENEHTQDWACNECGSIVRAWAPSRYKRL